MGDMEMKAVETDPTGRYTRVGSRLTEFSML